MDKKLTISNLSISKDKNLLKIPREENIKTILLYFWFMVFIIVLSFTTVFLKEFGAIILLTLSLLYFFTKKIGQEILIFLTLVFSTNVLEFFNIDLLPYLQLGTGLRFNALDLLIIPLSIRSYLSLRKDGTNTFNMKFITFLIMLSTIYVVLGLLFTGSPKEAGFNYYRVLFYPAFYFALLKYFLINNNKNRLIYFLSFLVIISTIIQLYEYILNYRLTIPGYQVHDIAFSEEGVKIFTYGGERLYVWSRTTGFLFLILGISLAMWENRLGNNKLNLLLVLICFIGFIIATVRMWIVLMLILALVVFIFSPRKRSVLINVATIIVLLSILITLLSSLTYYPGQVDLITSLISRVESITNTDKYGEQNTFLVRVIVNEINFNKFLESPIWGHGFGKFIYSNYYNNDVGITNRLVQFGLLGTLPILFFSFSNIFHIIREIKLNKHLSRKNRTLLISVLAILIAYLPGYLWQFDFWSEKLVFVLLIALALSDSIFLETYKFKSS